MRKADYLSTLMCRLSRDPGSLNLLEASGPIQVCIGIAVTCDAFNFTGVELNNMLYMLYQEMKVREARCISGFGFPMNTLYIFSSYLTKNTIRLRFKYQSVNAV